MNNSVITFSPLRKVLICTLFLSLLFVLETASAAFTDISAGSWYASTVNRYQQEGLLHRDGSRFRPSENATRADFIQLILDVQGGIRQAAPEHPSFNDVPKSEWYFVYMEEAARIRWVRGDFECYGKQPCFARPLGNINRAEAAALLVRAFGFEPTEQAPYFTDNTVGNWYTNVIQTAADHCILRGDDATKMVRPGDNMNRAEMVAMVDRARGRQTYGIDCGDAEQVLSPRISNVSAIDDSTVVIDFTTDLNPGSVTDTLRYSLPKQSSYFAVSASLVRPQGIEVKFNKPFLPNKRYDIEVKSMVSGDGITFSDTGIFTGVAPLVDAKGVLTVATSQIELLSNGVPKGALRTHVLSVNFKASCDQDLTIEGLDLFREGPGSRSDIDGVYAMMNGERITRKRTVDSRDNSVSLTFTRPVIVPACKSVTVNIAADFQSTAAVSGQHRFTVRAPSNIIGNAKRIDAEFPLQGRMFTIAAIGTGIVTVEYRSISPSEVEVAKKNAVIGKFVVSTDSVENQTLQSALLSQEGSVKPGDLSNVHIRRTDGTKITNTLQRTTGDTMLLSFDPPLLVRQGDTLTLEVVADIVGGAGRTIQLELEEESDLFAYGSKTGLNVSGRAFGSRVNVKTTVKPAFVAIDAGGFIVETDGPPQQSYANDDRGAVLANVLMTSGDEAIFVKSFFILIQGQAHTGAGFGNGGTASDDDIQELLKNLKLRNTTTGKTISATRLTGAKDSFTSSSKSYQVYRFDSFTVRGKELWELQTDFVNNGATKHPLAGDKFRAHICGESTHTRNANGALAPNPTGCTFAGVLSSASTAYQMQVEGLSTGDRIADVRPRGTISGNFQNIATAALTVAVQSQSTQASVIKGAKNVPLLRFEMRAGNVRDLRLTKLIFTASEGFLQNAQSYSLWRDTTGNGQVDTAVQTNVASQSNAVTFNQLSANGGVLPASNTVVFEVRANIASSPVNNTLQLAFATYLNNYLEAEKYDGANLSGIRTNAVCSGTCDISVNTVPATKYIIGSQGNLYVSQSSSPVPSRQLLGGSLSDPVLELQMSAQGEPIDVTFISVTSALSNATSIDRLELFEGTNTTSFASATVSGCGTQQVISTYGGVPVQTFCATMQKNQLLIPANTERKVRAKARVKNDQSGGVRGQPLQFWVSGQAVGGQSTIRARGLSSSTDLIPNNGNSTAEGEVFIGRDNIGINADIFSDDHTVVMAKVQSISNASPLPVGSAIPIGVVPIGQFAFKAAPNSNTKNGNNDVVIADIIFNVNASNIQLDAGDFVLYNKENASVSATCDPINSAGTVLTGTVTGVFYVRCEGLNTASVSSVIQDNASITLALRGNVLNPSVSQGNSTLQVSLQNIANPAFTTYGVSSSHIRWLDSDGSGTQENFWFELPDTSVTSSTYRN